MFLNSFLNLISLCFITFLVRHLSVLQGSFHSRTHSLSFSLFLSASLFVSFSLPPMSPWLRSSEHLHTIENKAAHSEYSWVCEYMRVFPRDTHFTPILLIHWWCYIIEFVLANKNKNESFLLRFFRVRYLPGLHKCMQLPGNSRSLALWVLHWPKVLLSPSCYIHTKEYGR